MAPHWFHVLDHLSKLPGPGFTERTAPRGAGQLAVRAATGLSRAHVALVLGYLRKRDAVTVELLHISGKKRRVRSYRVSPWGFKLLANYVTSPGAKRPDT